MLFPRLGADRVYAVSMCALSMIATSIYDSTFMYLSLLRLRLVLHDGLCWHAKIVLLLQRLGSQQMLSKASNGKGAVSAAMSALDATSAVDVASADTKEAEQLNSQTVAGFSTRSVMPHPGADTRQAKPQRSNLTPAGSMTRPESDHDKAHT